MKVFTGNTLLLLTLWFAAWAGPASQTGAAQQADKQLPLQKDYSFVMEVPGIINMLGTPTHLYILSEDEGLILFRSRADTLQWLYSSPDMHKRGNKLRSDIRFAYQFGAGKRLTILEPSSVLGVYSSTEMPIQPKDITRIEDNAYIALDSLGLGKIDLQSPESVDTSYAPVGRELLNNQNVIAVENSLNRLFVLSQSNELAIFEQKDNRLSEIRSLQLDEPISTIHVTRDQLLGSTKEGTVYRIDARGSLKKLFEIKREAVQIHSWNSHFVVKDVGDNIWFIENGKTSHVWKEGDNDAFHVGVIKDQLWLSEYNKVSRVRYRSKSASNADTSMVSKDQSIDSNLELKSIDNKTIPYPQPLLLYLDLNTNYPANDVQYSYNGPLNNVKIRGQSLYWQPGSGDIGTHPFEVIATGSDGQVDTVSFSVDVRSFNAPPRFSPIRTMSIVPNETFTLPITARDPDGMNSDLIRYMGVDLPDGAEVDPKTGRFTWEPSIRQVGEHTFQVIATDQYGAAASVDVTLNVIESQSRQQ